LIKTVYMKNPISSAGFSTIYYDLLIILVAYFLGPPAIN